MRIPPLAEFRPLHENDVDALAIFFRAISPDEAFFHPHPLTRESAERLCGDVTLDEYVVSEVAGTIVAYGMLRGWDEGYDVPSLGIAVHPAVRGTGVGREMMLHLHEIATKRGSPSVRLKVYANNEPAVALYRSLGYVLTPLGDDELLGILRL